MDQPPNVQEWRGDVEPALIELLQRSSRLKAQLLLVSAVAGAVALIPSYYLVAAIQVALHGGYFMKGTAVMAALVAAAASFTLYWGAARTALRVRLPAWVTEIASSYEIPPRALEERWRAHGR